MLFASSQPRIGAKTMTDNEHFSDGDRNRATDDRSPHAHRRWTDVLMHRWPTALGIAVAALTAFGLWIDAEEVSFLSALVVLMPLVYVGAVVRTPAFRSARVTREKRGRSEATTGADQEPEGNRSNLYLRSDSDLARSR
jgi:hypothetical protein